MRGPLSKLLALFSLGVVSAAAVAESARGQDAPVSFAADVRSILSDHCFQCHGPDAKKRQGELRLDTKEGAFARRDAVTIAPGKPGSSELIRRILSDDEDERMPPPETERRLTASQIETLQKWIADGAPWQNHWSLTTPTRPKTPVVKSVDLVRNPIDAFVLAKLEERGLSLSREASRGILLRRVTLDLTGLPPTPSELDSFVNDPRPDAYDRAVERLLASSRYGERMATRWLYAARYADTSGYQNDGPRYMWRWRDWVIDAYNSSMPFDQFTIEQLAGDLLPKATIDQVIATGFNRNHRGNAEGGIIPEEFAVEYVVDRVDTTATVWMGLTISCARCHEHKFDPIDQREFYELYAFFNNVPEHGRAVKEGNSPPFIKAPNLEQRSTLKRLNRLVADASKKWKTLQPEVTKAQRVWEQSLAELAPLDFTINEDAVARLPLDKPAKPLEFVGGEAAFVAGPLGKAAAFDGKRFIAAGTVGKFGYFDSFSISAWIRPDSVKRGAVVTRMTDVPRGDGYYLQLVDGKLQFNLVKRWLDDSTRVETERSIPVGEWTHVAAVYDGSRLATGLKIYLNGEPAATKVNLDYINQTFANDEPIRIGGGGGAENRFRGSIDEVRIYNRALTAGDAAVLAVPQDLRALAAIAPRERSTPQRIKLRRAFLDGYAPDELRRAYFALLEYRADRKNFSDQLPTVMVMEELPKPRPTHVLTRGEYDKPGELVTASTPTAFPPLPAGAPNNRLGLARWLVDPSHPLTARVAVNRDWQMFFGEGLVATVEDFGSQGARPTHPALLDWLATEFVRGDWSLKSLHRLIVTSATYRQTSAVGAAAFANDPNNKWLGRGPRLRLPAELVRDQALAISGLLSNHVGGPSVKPYQPEGLWKEIATDGDYSQDHGPSLYRRSMYIYWKRTVAPPTMVAFDATARETCTVRETRTNTPLQALTLLNETSFVEAARVFAQRTLAANRGKPAAEQIKAAFRRATSRWPTAIELRILEAGWKSQRAAFQKNPADTKLLLAIGEYPVDASIDAVELASFTTVTSLLLNLDEIVTKH